MRAVGIDFGTTNSALAIVGDDGRPQLARFGSPLAAETFRSILFFDSEPQAEAVLAGHKAIARYLEAGGNGRLVQSLKSFLADRLFHSTDILGTTYRLEDLITPIIAAVRAEAEQCFGDLGRRVIAGRPVHFAGAENAKDDELATARLEIALRRAGWDQVIFEYEPVAAAYDYGTRLTHAETVLIADFGGGTSDFSLVRLDPGGGASSRYEIIGNDGVALAGDAFDGAIIRHLVAAELGRSTLYRSPYGRVLPVPTWIYTKLEGWHHLSVLKARATMAKLEELSRSALEPARIRALIHIVDNDLGYALFEAVEEAKLFLSERDAATLRFRDPPIAIEKGVARNEFENWIRRDLDAIERCVGRLLTSAGLDGESVDSVFLTGGSSLVPAVKRIFAARFGEKKLRMGGEFTSVARGLALRAAR